MQWVLGGAEYCASTVLQLSCRVFIVLARLITALGTAACLFLIAAAAALILILAPAETDAV